MRILNLILSSLLISFASFDLTLLLAQEILVKPYVQPGDGNTLKGTDVKIIAWLTDQKEATFVVEYGIKGEPVLKAKPVRISLDFEKPKPFIDIIKPKVVPQETQQQETKPKVEDKKEE